MAAPDPKPAPTVWDLPTRLFHWLLVALLIASWLTAEVFERFDLHFYSGYAILTLILFRLIWGAVGSETARFKAFLRGPQAVLHHIGHLLGKGRDTAAVAGHNPLGGWMVVVLILAVGVQAVTGLFTTDDLFTDGPLVDTVSASLRRDLSALHRAGFNVLLALAALHILAVAWYWLGRGENLVRPMITGRSLTPVPPPKLVSTTKAVIALVIAGALVYAAIQGALVWAAA